MVFYISAKQPLSEEKESSTDEAHEEDDVANYNLIAKERPDLFLWCTKSRDEG